MKRLAFILIAGAALILGSCQQEGYKDITSDGSLTTITAGREARTSTRSALTEEGENLWSVGDQILVGYAGQTPSAFTSKEKEPSQTAKFSGLLSVNNSGDNTLYAIYPAEDGNTVNKDGTFSLQFHSDQTGVANTYDPDAFMAVAESQDKNLSFYNVLGLLKMQVADADIVMITLKPGAAPEEEPSPTPKAVEEIEEASGAFPGGVLTVAGGSAPEVTGYTEELESISLSAPDGGCFDPDAFYYMAVAPCILKNGAVFELEKEDGSVFSVTLEGEKQVERSKIHDVGLLEKHIPVTGVEFENDAEEVVIDGTITLIPTVTPDDASDPTLTWSSSDESIATVDDEGNVTGVAEGEAVITATSVDGPSGSVTVTVYPPYIAVQSITLQSPSPLCIPINGSASVTVEYEPENADNKDVTWAMGGGDDDEIAEVDENGKVTARMWGETTLRATSVDGPYDEIRVIVYLPIEGVAIYEWDLPDPLYIGDSGDLILSVEPFEALYSNVQWSSSNEDIATVSSSGIITANAEGWVKITVTVEDIVGEKHSGTISIYVSNPIQEVYIGTDDDLSEFHVGNSIAMYSETRPVEGGSVEWSSSDPDVATVDSDGIVTAQKIGKTKITATAANGVKSNEYEVEVVPWAIEDIFLVPTGGIELYNKDDYDYVGAAIIPEEANDGSHIITFLGYDTSVVNVDANGKVTVVGEGYTEIYVSVDGVSYGSVSVYVDLPDPISRIEFTPESYSMFMSAKPGDSGQLSYILCPEDNDGVYESIVWSSSDEDVATVDQTGFVTVKAYGGAEIFVTVYVDSDHFYSDSVIINAKNY